MPPLGEFIQIMRTESVNYHEQSKDQERTVEQNKELGYSMVRVRNVKLLIQDVFKQFDLLFKELDKN
jgi:hypothetical protein